MTTVDILRQLAGLIEYRSLPAPRIISVDGDFVALHMHDYSDVSRWATEFHRNLHPSDGANGDRSWSVDFTVDGLHVRVMGYEHPAAVA